MLREELALAEISVIVPTYNNVNAIQRTIASVVAQTFSDWELIVINDGSTDGTADCVRMIGDDRIRLFSFDNAGVATARNRGIDRAQGRFLAFLDADDLWAPKKLENQRQALLQDSRADVAYSWTVFLDENGLVQFRQIPEKIVGDTYRQILTHNFLMCGSTPLIRREAIESTGYFDASHSPVEDWDYFIRLARHHRFTVVPEHEVFYSQSAGSASAQLTLLESKIMVLHEKAFSEVPPGLKINKKRALAHIHYYLASKHLNHITGKESLKSVMHHFIEALHLDPGMALDAGYFPLYVKYILTRFLPKSWLERGVRWRRSRHTPVALPRPGPGISA